MVSTLSGKVHSLCGEWRSAGPRGPQAGAAWGCKAIWPVLNQLRASYPDMIKGVAIAALVLACASLADQQLSYGRYTDAAVALLRDIDRSFRR